MFCLAHFDGVFWPTGWAMLADVGLFSFLCFLDRHSWLLVGRVCP